ncbi:MAG: acid shock protein [Patescibacteria group bacterium]
MKKYIIILGIFAMGTSSLALAADTTETPANTMTIRSVEWSRGATSEGENKLLKAKVNFHYEGDFLEVGLGSEYNFNISCSITRNTRGGTKYLFYEIRDLILEEDAPLGRSNTVASPRLGLDDNVIEGPKDFSHTFVLTFTPGEFAVASKRTVNCSFGYSNDDYVTTKFAPETERYRNRFKAQGNTWKKLK